MPTATVVHRMMENQLSLLNRGRASFPPIFIFPKGENNTKRQVITMPNAVYENNNEKCSRIKSFVFSIDFSKKSDATTLMATAREISKKGGQKTLALRAVWKVVRFFFKPKGVDIVDFKIKNKG